MVEILVPFGAFTMIVLLVFIPLYFRYRGRRELQLTVREIVASGRELDVSMLNELQASLNPPDADLRRGVVAVAIGVAVVLLAFLQGQAEAVGPILGVAAFPFALGVAYIVLWRKRGAAGE